MKIAFFTETGYEGKFPRNNPNMRTDAAWICALNATHHPISVIHNIPSNSYDWGIVIIPKKKDGLVQYPLVENMKRVCSKVAVMQESTYWYWQDDKIESQVWYHSVLQSMDLIFCHNDLDVNYYSGITDVRCELLPSLMITDYIKVFDGERDGVMVGGNWASIYRGFDSYMISQILSTKITSPTTGKNSKIWENGVKYFYDIAAWYPKNMIIVNKDAWSKLDPATQKLVMSEAAKAEKKGWALSKKGNKADKKALADAGMKVGKVNSALNKHFKEVGATMSKEWASRAGSRGQAVLAAYK